MAYGEWISSSESAVAYCVSVQSMSERMRTRCQHHKILNARAIYIPDLIKWRRSIPANKVKGRRYPLWDLRTGQGKAEALAKLARGEIIPDER